MNGEREEYSRYAGDTGRETTKSPNEHERLPLARGKYMAEAMYLPEREGGGLLYTLKCVPTGNGEGMYKAEALYPPEKKRKKGLVKSVKCDKSDKLDRSHSRRLPLRCKVHTRSVYPPKAGVKRLAL